MCLQFERIRWVTISLLVTLTCMYGCIPPSGIRVYIDAETKPTIEFRNSLLQVVERNGYTPDTYSDVAPDNAPFRNLGTELVATFSHRESTRLSMRLSIPKNHKKAELWIAEPGHAELSPHAIDAGETILRELRKEFGSDNVSVKRINVPNRG